MEEMNIFVQMYSFLEVKLRQSLKKNQTKIYPRCRDRKQHTVPDSSTESTSQVTQ